MTDSGFSMPGPSPRGWGEPGDGDIAIHGQRTIPTRVGRTARAASALSIASDHPHAGGENWSATMKPVCPLGPSPRGWGERL